MTAGGYDVSFVLVYPNCQLTRERSKVPGGISICSAADSLIHRRDIFVKRLEALHAVRPTSHHLCDLYDPEQSGEASVGRLRAWC